MEELKGCVSKFQTSSVQRASDESPLIYEDETQVKIDEKETAELQEEAKATVEIKIETQITEKTHNQFTPKDLGIEVKNYTITGMRIADTQLSKAINIDVIVGT